MIKVYDTVTKATFIFPMLPDKITFDAGTNFISYDLLKKGEVKIPSGELLSSFSWDGVLPGKKRKNSPYVSNWREPREIQELFSAWRYYGRKLRLTIEGTPINHGVYLESYKIDYKGGMGDYEYSISFVSARDIVVDGTSRKSMTYVTCNGDTLWSIAQKQTGSGSNYTSVKNEVKSDSKTGSVSAGQTVKLTGTQRVINEASRKTQNTHVGTSFKTTVIIKD